MPSNRPVLDDIELELVQKIDSDQDQVLNRTSVPGLEGDFLESEGRRATTFTLNGVMVGETSAESLEKLRKKFREAKPIPFVSDISTAVKVDQVLIEDMGVRDLAGRPERFEYALTLREFKEAPTPPIEPPIEPPVNQLKTTLEVKVTVLNEPTFDFSHTRVFIEGTASTGATVNRELTTKTSDNVWREDPMEPGNNYTVRATADDLTGSNTVTVVEHIDPNTVEIVLRRTPVGNM